jgi:hypothetical protein
MSETQVTVRKATDADLRRVAREVLGGARSVPGIGPRALGWLIPRPVLTRIYAWLIGTERGEIWIAESATAFATVVLLRRGNHLEAVDFVSTGGMLGLVLATRLLRRADAEELTVVLGARGRARESYFRRLGFRPLRDGKMIRRPLGSVPYSGPMPAGYSGTPQARKLRLKPGQSVSLDHPPQAWELTEPPAGIIYSQPPAPADVIIAFFTAAAQLPTRLPDLTERIHPSGALWVAWPRRATGHDSDITDTIIREHGLALGVVDVKVAEIDEDWSGLRFVWRLANR